MTLTLQEKEKHYRIGQPLDGTAAQQYGSDESLMALATRIGNLHPMAEKLGRDGCMYLAQFALASGAKVLPVELGEVQIWEDKGELVIMLGFEYHNRVAHESGGYMPWPDARPMDARERTEYGVQDSDLASICKIIRKVDLEWVREVGIIGNVSNGGMNVGDVFTNMAYVGKATVTREEMATGRPPIGRTWQTVCDRRAKKDALARAFGTSVKPVHIDGDEPQQTPKSKSKGGQLNDMPLDEFNDAIFG